MEVDINIKCVFCGSTQHITKRQDAGKWECIDMEACSDRVVRLGNQITIDSPPEPFFRVKGEAVLTRLFVVDDLQLRYLKLSHEANEQFIRKNTDYGSSFRKTVLDIPASKACYVRLKDKIERIERLMSGNDALVKSETLRDTFMDLAVYALLEIICLEDENPKV